MSFLRVILAAGLIGLLTACGGGGGGSSSGGTGALSLNVTDAPVSDADISAVWVRFTDVIVKPDGNGSQPITIPVSDNLGHDYIDIDLKSLTAGKTATLLGQHELPAGHYSWMRLVIDPDPANTYVVETGGWQGHCRKDLQIYPRCAHLLTQNEKRALTTLRSRYYSCSFSKLSY